jgi:diadenosine tetraphosphate (Ap4A) HIT family hydrolase
MAYDDGNVFAKILRGEIPCRKVHEDEFALAFHDINPLAPVHVLVIPKGPYVTLEQMTAEADPAFVAGFFRAMGAVVRQLGIDQGGYRILANNGRDAHQEVMHLHFHLFAGRPLGPMLKRAE